MSVVTTSITASATAGVTAGVGANRRRTYTAHACPKDMTIAAAEADFAAQFGVSPREICGRALGDLFRAGAPARLPHRFTDLSEGRTDWFTERVAGRHIGGRVFAADLTAIAVTGPAGPAGLVLLLRPLREADLPHPRALTLSELDARVLEGVAGGASTVQLAGRLYLSRQGVEYRVGLLLRRFDAPNRPALVARAHALGLFAPGQWPPQVLPDLVE
ncbi:LuxR family transcriptional regulator [Streptomyces sp. LP11]|uniref:LuxR family transcriptional regulator n=1 Tax=Streptomyces pyxinicus TaxID=2970331 RepID=A0ABT2B2J0_9ACTN|nr:LuxR family transcriptional regulator [Streptomyces sp. LP11]MCS0602711.1 LuxR family transcriptional regulator [Streptomyces sp. LP11]